MTEQKRRRETPMEKLERLTAIERALWDEGSRIAGIDEVGRGPLAGPVVTACVCIPRDRLVPGVDDSKKLSEKRREALYPLLMEAAEYARTCFLPPSVIDEVNILNATYEAMREAISKLSRVPQLLLNDAVTIPGVEIPQLPIIKGDAKSASIAAASIVAKVTRDRLMVEMDKVYPGYGFAAHKGYGTAAHIAALKELGPCPIHRRSFIGKFVDIQT